MQKMGKTQQRYVKFRAGARTAPRSKLEAHEVYGGLGLRHIEREDLAEVQAHGIAQPLLREIVLPVQVQMAPVDDGVVLEGRHEGLLPLRVRLLSQALGEIQ